MFCCIHLSKQKAKDKGQRTNMPSTEFMNAIAQIHNTLDNLFDKPVKKQMPVPRLPFELISSIILESTHQKHLDAWKQNIAQVNTQLNGRATSLVEYVVNSFVNDEDDPNAVRDDVFGEQYNPDIHLPKCIDDLRAIQEVAGCSVLVEGTSEENSPLIMNYMEFDGGWEVFQRLLYNDFNIPVGKRFYEDLP